MAPRATRRKQPGNSTSLGETFLVNHGPHNLTTLQVNLGSSWLEVVTALATLGAVIVAVWTTNRSQRALQRELELARLVERRRAAMALLEAFEGIQQLRAPQARDRKIVVTREPEELALARARYVAQLLVSEEPLVLARGLSFRHIPFGSGDNPEERRHYEQARELGDPETETSDVRKVRGEIVSAIEALNAGINRSPGHSAADRLRR
jgi:hypothetical protein